MPSNRASTRKRQTRLAFTPLPSSSPAAAKYSSQIQDRAAAVRYSDPATPSKRRRLTGHLRDGATSSPNGTPGTDSSGGRVDFAVMETSSSPSMRAKIAGGGFPELKLPPTPIASSQVELRPSLQDPDRSTSSDSSDSDSETGTPRQVSTNPFSIRKDNHAKGVDSQIKTPGLQDTPQAMFALGEGEIDTSRTTDSRVQRSYPTKELPRSASESDDLPILSGRKRNGSAIAVIVSSGDESDVSQIRPRRNSKRVNVVDMGSHTQRHSRPILSPRVNTRHFLLGGSTGNAPVSRLRHQKVVNPVERPKPNPQSSARRHTRSGGRAEKTASPIQRRTRSSTVVKQQSRAAPVTLDNRTNDAFLDDEESDDGVPMPTDGGSAAGQTSIKTVVIASEESEEDLVLSPKMRRRRIRLNKNSPTLAPDNTKQREDDVENDLEDLQDTKIRNGRTRSRGSKSKRTAAQKQLELLRRRRAGEKITELSDSEGDPPPRRGIYDSDSQDGNVLVALDDISEEDNNSGTDYIRQSLRAGAQEYDEDFVDDNEDDNLGAPHGLGEIPLEFTMHAHKKPREHFKDAVEWMVHNKLNPAFPRHDPVYKNAFYKLDDVVKGYSSSKFVSAAWSSQFSKALKARPEFEEIRVPTMFDNKCDACNRSGHPTKYRITFSGKAYHHESLEDISEDEDDDEGDDDAKSHDSRGFSIPGTDVQYFVGRFCRANAQTAHALIHWRYHLNQWVLDWLKTAGHTEPSKIVDRESWSKKRRRDFANEVVDGMEENGEIKALYRDFKINLEAARDAKPSRYGDRDDD